MGALTAAKSYRIEYCFALLAMMMFACGKPVGRPNFAKGKQPGQASEMQKTEKPGNTVVDDLSAVEASLKGIPLLNSTVPYQWLAIDDSIYTATIVEGKKVFPVDAPMTKRLQAWSDKFYDQINKLNPETKIIPRPVIRVVEDESFNAYVGSGVNCVDVKIGTSTAESAAPEQAGYLIATSDGVFSVTKPMECSNFQGDLAEKRNIVAWAIRDLNGCSVAIVGDALQLNDACFIIEGMTRSFYKGVAIQTVPNYVTFNSALLEKSTEYEAVSVLAHELVHYIVSHSTANRKTYDYFYEQKDRKRRGSPVALSETDPDVKKARDLAELLKLKFQEIDQQLFHSLLFEMNYALANVISESDETSCLTTSANCVAKCSAFVDNADKKYGEDLEYFPEFTTKIDSYFAYEKDAQTCFAGVKADALQGYVKAYFKQNFTRFLSMTPPDAKTNQSFLAYLRELNPIVTDLGKRLNALRDQTEIDVTKKNLGWFTTEQEADEKGLRFIISIGLSPDHATQFFASETFNPSGAEKCLAELKNGFMNPILIGSLEDDHHDSCYRAYNDFFEAKAYPAFSASHKEPTVESPITWEAAVKLLK